MYNWTTFRFEREWDNPHRTIIALVSQHKLLRGRPVFIWDMGLLPVTKLLHVLARRTKPEGHMILSGDFDASIECKDVRSTGRTSPKQQTRNPKSLVSKSWRLLRRSQPNHPDRECRAVVSTSVPSVLCRSSHSCLVLLLLLYFLFLFLYSVMTPSQSVHGLRSGDMFTRN